MKNTIRTIFGLKKKSKGTKPKTNNHYDNSVNQIDSHSSSASSLSSATSEPRTPNGTEIQECLGIFRTLEPVWYFESSLLPNHGNLDWIRFDDQSQRMLENSLHNGKDNCILYQSPIGSCTISFKPLPPKPTKKASRYSMMTPSSHRSSEPSLRPHQPHLRTLELNKHIRRTISPIWWFEQDSEDGTKGMCRFDHKNQVRLEALSEGRSHLILTDDAFSVPFTVVLEQPKQRESREEVRGFLYLEPVSTAFQLAYFDQENNKMMEYIDDIYHDDFYQDDLYTLVRRNSI